MIQVSIPRDTLVAFNKKISCPAIPRRHPAQISFLFPYFGRSFGIMAIPTIVAIWAVMFLLAACYKLDKQYDQMMKELIARIADAGCTSFNPSNAAHERTAPMIADVNPDPT